MKLSRFYFLVYLLLLMMLSACGAGHIMHLESARDRSEPTEISRSADPVDFAGKDKPGVTDVAMADARKLHYDGEIKLLVTNPRSVLKNILAIINRHNGYLERSSKELIVLQVPVLAFDTAFTEILTLGKVLHKLVTTVDITAEYTSVDLRLQIARSTRDRLVLLLAKAINAEQKLGLLLELEKINRKIQRLELLFDALKVKVDYSKITVNLASYNRFSNDSSGFEPAGMRWITHLSPYTDSVARSSKSLKFTVPKGMLSVKKHKHYWAVESGDKVFFRAYQRENTPKGNTPFWLNSIKLRLQDKYKKMEEQNAGKFKLLRFVSYDDTPAVYYVGLIVQENSIKMLELFFPDTSLEDKYRVDIINSIGQGAL